MSQHGSQCSTGKGKGKTDADTALESLIGHEIYVHGTGGAREVRRDGVLRKVGDVVRVESQGSLMGFNDFCASANNSKKRPRQAIHLVRSGISLKQATDEILGKSAQGNESSSSDEDGAQRRTSSGGGSLGAGPSANGHSSDSKRPKVGAKTSGTDDFVGNRELLQSAEYKPESEIDHTYDQPPVDFTQVLPGKRRISPAAQKEAHERRARALRTCLNVLKILLLDNLSGPVYDAEDNSWGLGEIRTKLENDEYRTHGEFAAAVRKVLDQGQEELKDDTGETLSDKFEEKYLGIADQVQLEEEEATARLLPRPLEDMPQRHLDSWCIINDKGAYLAPWHGCYACYPGGVLATLSAPARPPFADKSCTDGPLKVRIEAVDEWHAQCLDPLGCKLPQYWVRGAATPGEPGGGARGGRGKVWYQLGKPAEGYLGFLRSESSWLMASYRIANFLYACPKSTFSEVCEVLGGRNWVQDIDENKPPFLRDGTEGGNRLDQLPLEDVLEKAERVIEELSEMYPKLASHKFCNSLMARYHKYVRRKARGLTGAQISSLRMMGGAGIVHQKESVLDAHTADAERGKGSRTSGGGGSGALSGGGGSGALSHSPDAQTADRLSRSMQDEMKRSRDERAVASKEHSLHSSL